MLGGIVHICLLASFLLLPLSSAVPDGGFTGAPSPWDHSVVPSPETAPSPTPTTSPPTASQPSHSPAAPPSPINNGSVSGDITWWCNKTPHAETCNYYFRKNNINRPPRFRSEFLRFLVNIALDQAVITHTQTVKFGPSCTSNQRKAAWSDCVKLFENTVAQLNRTLQGLNASASDDVRCTNFDAQTWLSTAQTNIETCRSGSEDLNVSDFVMPAISNTNLSDLIGNCLAVNGVLMKQHNHTTANHKEYFPSWVSRHERKLLVSASLAKSRPHLVVALDRSGHFRSIQAAINWAARRRVKSRFVIYVKKGVYRENIEVGNDNHNIMLVGDGARKTIITSGRSVMHGYTTYNSATAG